MPFLNFCQYQRPIYPGCDIPQGDSFMKKKGCRPFRPPPPPFSVQRPLFFHPHIRQPSFRDFSPVGHQHRDVKVSHRIPTQNNNFPFGFGRIVRNPFVLGLRHPRMMEQNRVRPCVPPPPITRFVQKSKIISPNLRDYDPYSWSNTQYTRKDRERERLSRGFYNNIQLSGKLNISQELQVDFIADDLHDLGEIGRGGFGTVNKMVHRKTNTIMAVKRIRLTVDENEQKQLRDLEVAMWSNDCPFIVQFYGATLKEGDCWICMELMDTSLDKFYKFVYEKLDDCIPETILGKITLAWLGFCGINVYLSAAQEREQQHMLTNLHRIYIFQEICVSPFVLKGDYWTLTALNYLKEKLKLIHRDVKPSNILLDRRGNIKLCDFGISGHLVDSIAKTRDAGCRPYMAPERIDPAQAKGYDVRSDVWSLGITLMELATGSFPYPKWNSVFEQLTQVVQGEPPRLNLTENGNTFTEDFVNFVNTWVAKDEPLSNLRITGSEASTFAKLLGHHFSLRASGIIRLDIRNEQLALQKIKIEDDNIKDKKNLNLIKDI